MNKQNQNKTTYLDIAVISQMLICDMEKVEQCFPLCS